MTKRRRQPANVRRQKMREHWDAVYLKCVLYWGDDFVRAIEKSRFESHEKAGYVGLAPHIAFTSLYDVVQKAQQPRSAASIRYLRYAHYRLTPPPRDEKSTLYPMDADKQWHDQWHAEQKRRADRGN